MRILRWHTGQDRLRSLLIHAAVFAVVAVVGGAPGAERVVLGEYFTMIG